MKKIILILLLFLFSFFDLNAQDTWLQRADYAGPASISTIAFSIGSKAYYGTGYNDVTCSNVFFEYDPVSNTWTQKANVSGGNRTGAVAFSIGNKGYVGLGSDCSLNNYNDFYEYDPLTNSWTPKANFAGSSRRWAAAFSVGGKGYVTTGFDGSNHRKDLWCYDPLNDLWTQKTDFGGTPRSNAVAFSVGNKGYVGTGFNGTTTVIDLWEYDPANNTWAQKANYPGIAVDGASAFTAGGKGYVGGGVTANLENKRDFFEYDPVSDSWTQRANIGQDKGYASGFAINNLGYIVGGQDCLATYTKALWQYTPLPNGISTIDELTGISLFPNPVVNAFTIYDERFTIEKMEMYSSLGEKVFSQSQTTNHKQQTVDVSQLPPGIYFITVTDQAGNKVSRKVVKM